MDPAENSDQNQLKDEGNAAIWTANESETYSTVSVCEHLNKLEKNVSSTGAIPKRLVAKDSKPLGNEDSKSSSMDLWKLYENKDEFDTPIVVIQKEEKIKCLGDIKLEAYNQPKTQQATAMQRMHSYLDEVDDTNNSVIVISDDDDDDETQQQGTKTKTNVCRKILSNLTAVKKTENGGNLNSGSATKATQSIKIPTTDVANQSLSQPMNTPALEQSNSSLKKTKVKPAMKPATKQATKRNLDLHQLRVAVEQKRLDLLEFKIRRERDGMLRDQILFGKDLEVKEAQIRQINENANPKALL